MPVIEIPKSFFRKERRDIYSYWELAFWRELFQNATDAGARRIQVSFSRVDNDIFRIVFDDDGCGMTREVLEQVYFRLGATTKAGANTIGGFGRARILTCFSMHAYRIVTLDNVVTGDGASYEIAKAETRHRGCRLEIDVDKREASYSDMREALDTYLRRSQIKAEVLVDGEPFDGWLMAGRALRQIADTAGRPIGQLHLNRAAAKRKSLDRGRLVVRVRGAYMFDRYVSGIGARMVLEIDPLRSREVLTASRDSLMREPQSVLDALLVDLAVESASAVRPKRANDTQVFRNSGFLTLAPEPEPRASQAESMSAAMTASDAPDSDERDFALEAAARGAVPELAAETASRAPLVATNSARTTPPPSPAAPMPAPSLPGLGDIHILSEDPPRKARTAAARFRPSAWDLEALARGKRGRGHVAYRLLRTWTTACELALQALQRSRNAGAIKWTTGFYFGDPETRAVCRGGLEGAILCLNPIDENGRLAWRVASRTDLIRLLAYARHEAAHVVCDTHDQNFANLLTELDAAMDDAKALVVLKRCLDVQR